MHYFLLYLDDIEVGFTLISISNPIVSIPISSNGCDILDRKNRVDTKFQGRILLHIQVNW